MNLVTDVSIDNVSKPASVFSVRVQCYPILVFHVERILIRDLRITLVGLLDA